MHATLWPALSVCWSVGRSVHPSVGNPWLFSPFYVMLSHFKSFWVVSWILVFWSSSLLVFWSFGLLVFKSFSLLVLTTARDCKVSALLSNPFSFFSYINIKRFRFRSISISSTGRFVAFTGLYNPLCRLVSQSVSESVSESVGPLVGRSVGSEFKGCLCNTTPARMFG